MKSEDCKHPHLTLENDGTQHWLWVCKDCDYRAYKSPDGINPLAIKTPEPK